jgi:hypothetical protein
VLTCGALAVLLGVQALLPTAQPLPDMSGRAQHRIRPIAAPAVPDYPAILQAPVFSPDRKPSNDEDAAPGAGPLGGFTALGVAMGHGFATAVMKGPDGVVSTLHVGDSVNGWRLVGVETTKLTFQRDTIRHELPVGSQNPTPATPQNGNDE